MAETTHREFQVWQAHFEEELDRPSRSDLYVMQLTAVVAGLFKEGVKPSDYRLRFGPDPAAEPLSDEEAMARSKAAWMGAAGALRRRT